MVLHARAIQSLGRVVRPARNGTFDVTRIILNGTWCTRPILLKPQQLMQIQSRNCTKHNCVCDYKSNPPLSDELSVPPGPNLLWTRPIEVAIEAWHQTGVCPFPNIGLHSGRQFQGLSREDLRLVYHLLSIHQDLERIKLSQCTLWVNELPRYHSHLDLRT